MPGLTLSYNGVDPSLKQSDFEKGVVRTRRYRNRRIGGFLKELELTEGRGTGIPTIIDALKNNGSPPAIFDTDEPNRGYFLVEIPVHPEFTREIQNEKGGNQDSDLEGLVERLVEGLVENQKKMVKLMIGKPTISKKEMSEQIGISTTAIDKNISTLKNKNIIKRIGGHKGGHWQVETPTES